MFEINKKFPEEIVFHGKKYKVNLAFDRVISFFTLWNGNNDLSDMEKLEIACEWFVPKSQRLKPHLKTELVSEIINKFINNKKKSGGNSVKIMDFEQDSSYIYASFISEYGIDLYKEQRKLHWYKFYSLFEGLSSDCIIKRIMEIRAMEIPAGNGKNGKEIQQLSELKALYALKLSDSEQKAELQNGLNKLFDILERKSQTKGVD